MTAFTHEDIKKYVQDGKRDVAADVVLIDMTHNLLKASYREIAFSMFNTIESVKDRVYKMTGSKPAYMLLLLGGKVPLLDESKTLAQLGIKTGSHIHIVDQDEFSAAKGGALEDVSLVKKYVMSDEDYDKRKNTYRAFKKKMLEKDPKWVPKHVKDKQLAMLNAKKGKGSLEHKEHKHGPDCEHKGDSKEGGGDGDAKAGEAKKEVKREDEKSVRERVKVGNRALVGPGDRRGAVTYVGPIPELDADKTVMWIGVMFDDPVGKNDGTVKGKRYFTCPAKRGGFIKPEFVQVGDYPELDLFASDDDEEGEKENSKAAAAAAAAADAKGTPSKSDSSAAAPAKSEAKAETATAAAAPAAAAPAAPAAGSAGKPAAAAAAAAATATPAAAAAASTENVMEEL